MALEENLGSPSSNRKPHDEEDGSDDDGQFPEEGPARTAENGRSATWAIGGGALPGVAANFAHCFCHCELHNS